MNLAIIANIRFEGNPIALDPLLDDIADAISKHGYGNYVDDPHSTVNSIVIVRENQFEGSAEEFVRDQMEGALQVILPTEQEVASERIDGGDEEGDDQRDASGTDRSAELQSRSGESLRDEGS